MYTSMGVKTGVKTSVETSWNFCGNLYEQVVNFHRRVLLHICGVSGPCFFHKVITKFSQSFHEVFTEFSQRFSQRFSQWFSQTVILMNQRALFLHAQYPLHPSIRLETIVKGSRDRKPAKLPWLVASPKWSSESVWFG